MPVGIPWRLVLVLCAVLPFVPLLPAEEASGTAAGQPIPKGIPRDEGIRQTLAGIEKQIADHGGSWEKWAETLKPYQDDIRGCVTDWQKYKWPWPAKKNYVFQGAAVSLHLRNQLEDLPEGERPLEGIVHFHRQLKALGIDLIVAFIPAKLSIYPDYIYAAVEGEQRPARAPADRIVSVSVLRLMHKLLQNDVEVVNLHEAFSEFRRTNGDDVPLYYVRDGHFINRGARLTAQKIAERLWRYDFVQKALAEGNRYTSEKSSRSDGDKADSDLLLIKDKRSGGFYQEAADSPVVVAGDSHLLYNDGKAQLTAQIAYLTGIPMNRIGREGVSRDIPLLVAKDGQLAKRKVIVTVYSERMITPKTGKTLWPLVNLPGADKAAAPAPPPAPASGQVKEVLATGTVGEAAPRPDTKADYPHCLMQFYLAKLADEAGKPIGSGDGVVHVLAMHNRKILPIADAKTDQPLTLRITTWDLANDRYRRLQATKLPAVDMQINKPFYFGEVPGQAGLTAEELARVGEEDVPEKRAEAQAEEKRAQAAPPPLDPANADWRVELNQAVSGKQLAIHMCVRNGRCQRAFAFSPTYNKAVHDVDASGLKISEGRAQGAIVVTVNADAWVPKDGKPVACRFDLDAVVKEGVLGGVYQGKFGEAEAKGAVAGAVEAPRSEAGPVEVELLLQNAIKGSMPHHRTANISFAVSEGKAAGGKAAGFDPKAWSGKITALDVRLSPDSLSGQLSMNVTSGVTPVTDGQYSFTLDGKVVGGKVIGKFTARYKDEELPGGMFSGAIVAKGRPEAPARKAGPRKNL